MQLVLFGAILFFIGGYSGFCLTAMIMRASGNPIQIVIRNPDGGLPDFWNIFIHLIFPLSGAIALAILYIMVARGALNSDRWVINKFMVMLLLFCLALMTNVSIMK